MQSSSRHKKRGMCAAHFSEGGGLVWQSTVSGTLAAPQAVGKAISIYSAAGQPWVSRAASQTD